MLRVGCRSAAVSVLILLANSRFSAAAGGRQRRKSGESCRTAHPLALCVVFVVWSEFVDCEETVWRSDFMAKLIVCRTDMVWLAAVVKENRQC